MIEIVHRPGMRECVCRIESAELRRPNDNVTVVCVTLATEGGEVFRDQFVMDRDSKRLKGLKWAVGWWARTLTGQQVAVLLDADRTIFGYGPSIQVDPEAINSFPLLFLLLCDELGDNPSTSLRE